MQVKQLIELLSEQDPEAEVYFEHDSHDYWGTRLASGVAEVNESEIQFSDYHSQYSVPKTPNEWEDEPEEEREGEKHKIVVLLS